MVLAMHTKPVKIKWCAYGSWNGHSSSFASFLHLQPFLARLWFVRI